MKRRWIFWLLVIGFLWVLVSHFTEFEKLINTLLSGQRQWIGLAVLVQMLYYVVFSGTYYLAFATVDVQSRIWDLIPVTLGALFMNVVAPLGGAAGIALFVDDASKHGQSKARATTGTMLQLIADFSAFTLVLIFGMVYLFIQHDLQVYEIISAVALLVITLFLSGMIALGFWRVEFLGRLLNWLQKCSGWINRKISFIPVLADDWSERTVKGFEDAAQATSRHPGRLFLTITVALVAHFLDIACLYLLFLAFGQPILLSPLVAGYAIGILFWIISPTPQGIGVVEGMMALVYTSLHIPPEVAITVSLAFRGLTFWLPLILGFFVLRRIRTFSSREHSLTEPWSVRIVAVLTGLMGLINILSAITPAIRQRLEIIEQFLPLAVRQGSHLAAALAGLALLLVARNLWRRKRVAWVVALVALTISAVSHILKGLDYEEAILSIGLALWLLYLRPYFHARSDSPSAAQGLRVLLFSVVFTLIYGTVGFNLLDHHFRVNYDLSAAVRQTLIMFSEFSNPGLEPITGFGRYFADSIYIIGTVSLGYTLLMLVRPVLVRETSTSEEREKARRIVESYGKSSLARITLLEDKVYYFSQGGSLIAYVVKGRVAIALGDPIGPSRDISATILSFDELCEHNDWSPAFYQTLPDHLSLYKEAGFETLCIGHEGIVHLDEFSLEGKGAKSLRSSYNRLTKLSYKVLFHQPPISNELLLELRYISDEWLTLVHGSEKRFSLGWFDDDYIRYAPIVAVHSQDGQVVAFANLVPEYQLNEITIDLMRHRRNVEPGTMEFLFVSLFKWAKEEGYASFNLGLSALFGIGEHPDDPIIERTMRFAYEHINQFYNFKGLHDFKKKFYPEWSPRYLIYPGAASLPMVWAAVVQADSGQGFLSDFIEGVIPKFSQKAR